MTTTKQQLRGGDYYERLSDGRQGVWRGVIYADGIHAELHDLETGRPFKAAMDNLTLIARR